MMGTSLVVHWLILHTSTAGDMGLIPGQGIRFHIAHDMPTPTHPPQKKSMTKPLTVYIRP